MGRWLASDDSLDDAELGALETLDLEALCEEVIERLAHQMVVLEAKSERLEQALPGADRTHREITHTTNAYYEV